jgi:hypothetical protein
MPLTTELLGPSPDPARLGAGEHNDGGGLYLVVRLLGSASWIFKFTFGGKAHKMGLGSFKQRNEVEARELAHKYRRMVRDGQDPRNERTADGVLGKGTSTPLFHPFATELLAKLTFKNEKSRACWKRCIDVHFAALHAKQLHQITLDDVVGVLRPLYVSTPSVGREARQRLEAILESAIVKHPTAMGRNVATRSILKATNELPKLPKKGTVRGGQASSTVHTGMV